MQTIQAFLTVVLCGFVWLTIILGLALAEEVTIYDKNWQVKERIQDGTIYDRDWTVKGHIDDGKVYDRNWNLEKRIEDGKIYEMSRQGAKFAKVNRTP
jgi:alpha-N-acetylglucosamine transferase